jgi:hypothetical protein
MRWLFRIGLVNLQQEQNNDRQNENHQRFIAARV